jgi:hypothetical protein
MLENDKAAAVGAAAASIDEQLTSKLDRNVSAFAVAGKATVYSARSRAAQSNSIRILNLRRLRKCARPWRVMLEGIDGELSLSSRELMCPTAFRRRCLMATGFLPPLLSPQDWLRIVGDGLSRVEVIELEGRSCPAPNSRG